MAAASMATPLHGAIALTIWFTLISTLVLLGVPITDTFGVLTVAIVYSFLLLPMRWVLILTLLIGTVRSEPLPMLPASPRLQVTTVIVLQIALGILSLLGCGLLGIIPSAQVSE